MIKSKTLKAFICFVLAACIFTSSIYTYPVAAAAQATSTLGDVNGNGIVTAADAMLTLRVAISLITFTDTQRAIADVNFDGNITAVDALIILRTAAGLNTLFSDDFSSDLGKWTSISGNWRIQDETLVQDQTGVGVLLLSDVQASNQTVQVRFNITEPDGYAGIFLWYESPVNYISIKAYPSNDAIIMEEMISGVCNYTGNRCSMDNDLWYQIKVVANVASGTISIYFKDTIVTRTISTTIRDGTTGIIMNNGGYFDDFKLSTSS